MPSGTVSPLAGFEGHFVKFVVRLTGGHLDVSPQVIAVTCEDGSCSLWLWSQPTRVGDLELPSGVSCSVLQHGGTAHLLTTASAESTAKCLLLQRLYDMTCWTLVAFPVAASSSLVL